MTSRDANDAFDPKAWTQHIDTTRHKRDQIHLFICRSKLRRATQNYDRSYADVPPGGGINERVLYTDSPAFQPSTSFMTSASHLSYAAFCKECSQRHGTQKSETAKQK